MAPQEIQEQAELVDQAAELVAVDLLVTLVELQVLLDKAIMVDQVLVQVIAHPAAAAGLEQLAEMALLQATLFLALVVMVLQVIHLGVLQLERVKTSLVLIITLVAVVVVNKTIMPMEQLAQVVMAAAVPVQQVQLLQMHLQEQQILAAAAAAALICHAILGAVLAVQVLLL
jgi:hypothetical protein